MAKTAKKRRKKRKRNVVIDYLQYIMLRIGLFIIFLSSIETNLRFARWLGRGLWGRYHRGRKRAMDNIRASFPEKDEQWCIETGRRSFEHLAMLAMDLMFTPRLVKYDNWQDYSRYINTERVKWLMQGGQGVIFVASHYGNFEVMGYILGLFNFDIYSVARPLDNRFISKYLYGIRERAGQKIIDKKGATEKIEQIAGSHSSISFIADQDAGKKGIFVDFFGRKASTYKSVGLIAMQYNMPIAVAAARRVGDSFFFEIEIGRLIMPEEWQDKDKPLDWITQEYAKATEDLIRKDPTQYWWLHRRWKTRPKAKRANVRQ
ncbi:MAG: lysophospholipid acyltransferase family protein [Planctomycetes bacterium]|nr:lysophospholipid acyltransferase family protein [Planctomycetota bacterium]